MGTPHEPPKAKLICGLLAGSAADLAAGIDRLAATWGAVERTSEVWSFANSTYYADEIGPSILRQFVSFAEPVAMDCLPEIKLRTNALEQEFVAERGLAAPRRPVNLDPGYVTLGCVLATTKSRPHRLYLGQGIFGEITLNFESGGWRSWPWTYPDYAGTTYHPFLTTVREELKQVRRTSRA